MNHLALAFLAAALPAVAAAQSLHQTADGKRLEIGLSCAKTINVVADPALLDRVVLDATAAHPEELAQLEFAGGDAVRLKLHGPFSMTSGHLLSLHGDCWSPGSFGGFTPTLLVTLHVPQGFALAVDASGDGAYHLAAGGTLDVDSSGSARIDATSLTRLNADMSGSGAVMAQLVTGPVKADLSGSGDVTLAQVSSPNVSVEQSGSSIFRIGGGTAGTLTVDSSGSGQVIMQGTVGNATVDTSGSGDVTIATLTGRLTQNTSGSGSVRVGSQTKE